MSCGHTESENSNRQLAIRVRHDTKRSWDAYRKYAWGKDVLLPLSKSGMNWYDQSLHISPIDAFSTLVLTGLTGDADQVVRYVADSVSFDKDFKAKVFEVNIRVLGGLLSMYQLSGDPQILGKGSGFRKPADACLSVRDRVFPTTG